MGYPVVGRMNGNGGGVMRGIHGIIVSVIMLSSCGMGDGGSRSGDDVGALADDASSEGAAQLDTTQSAVSTDSAPGAQAPAAFIQCQVCHSVDRGGRNGVGPNLWGIYGAKAGAVAGFAYSDAMLTSGIVWDKASLDEYLTSPAALVPGTKMTFAGVRKAEQRSEINSFLETLK